MTYWHRHRIMTHFWPPAVYYTWNCRPLVNVNVKRNDASVAMNFSPNSICRNSVCQNSLLVVGTVKESRKFATFLKFGICVTLLLLQKPSLWWPLAIGPLCYSGPLPSFHLSTEGWPDGNDLGGWLYTDMIYPSADSHQSKN